MWCATIHLYFSTHIMMPSHASLFIHNNTLFLPVRETLVNVTTGLEHFYIDVVLMVVHFSYFRTNSTYGETNKLNGSFTILNLQRNISISANVNKLYASHSINAMS